MQKTRVRQMLGLDWPIVQGPFGGGSTVKLTALVSELGGLGSYGAYMMAPEAIETTIAGIKAATSKPFNVNLWVSDHDPGGLSLTREEFDRAWTHYEKLYAKFGLEKPEPPKASYHPRFEDQAEVVLAARPPVFSFVFGVPSRKILDECRRLGILTAGGATTLAEAEVLEAAGVDCIVASGFEAAGHRPSFLAKAEDSLTGVLALTRVLTAKLKTPIISAGGIVDGAGAKAVLDLGAGAAQIGTAFFACEESGANAVQRDAIFSGKYQSVLTRNYSGRLLRGLGNSLALENRTPDSWPPFPIHAWFMAKVRNAAAASGDPEWAALYGGQGMALVKHRKAADLMRDLIAGVESA
jgi:nitronate monooxygenase